MRRYCYIAVAVGSTAIRKTQHAKAMRIRTCSVTLSATRCAVAQHRVCRVVRDDGAIHLRGGKHKWTMHSNTQQMQQNWRHALHFIARNESEAVAVGSTAINTHIVTCGVNYNSQHDFSRQLLTVALTSEQTSMLQLWRWAQQHKYASAYWNGGDQNSTNQRITRKSTLV